MKKPCQPTNRILAPEIIEQIANKHKITWRGSYSIGVIVRPFMADLLILQDAKSYCIGALDANSESLGDAERPEQE